MVSNGNYFLKGVTRINKTDGPKIIEASNFLGLLPSTLGSATEIDWIPVDLMGDILVELALDRLKPGTQEAFYHGVNAHKTSWTDILAPVVLKLLPHTSLMSWKDWVSALSKAITAAGDPTKVPGAPLIAFFEGIGSKERESVLDTTNTSERSGVFRDLGAVDGQWMELWMNQWGYC